MGATPEYDSRSIVAVWVNAPGQTMPKRRFVLVVILLLAAGLRCYRLGDFPPLAAFLQTHQGPNDAIAFWGSGDGAWHASILLLAETTYAPHLPGAVCVADKTAVSAAEGRAGAEAPRLAGDDSRR